MIKTYKSAILKRVVALFVALAVGVGLPLVAKIFDAEDIPWFIDLATHWQMQYSAGLVGVAVLCLLAEAWLLALASVVLAIMPWVTLAGGLPDYPADKPNYEAITIASANLMRGEANFSVLKNSLAENIVDFLAVQELTPDFASKDFKGLAGYPYAVTFPAEGSFGIGFLSKWPIVDFKQHTFSGDSAIEVMVVKQGKIYNFWVVHPMPPVTEQAYSDRDAYLREVARTASKDSIIVGDFNSTLWARGMSEFPRNGFRRASGLAPTYSLWGGLALDHVFAGELEWKSIRTEVLPDIGSDHRPLLVSLTREAPRDLTSWR